MKVPVFEVRVGDNVFYAQTWDEVHSIWNEHVWAVGAEDAGMTVKFVSC